MTDRRCLLFAVDGEGTAQGLFTVIEEAGMDQDRISELEHRIAQLEKQVGELGEVVTQSEDVGGLAWRGGPSRRSTLATYVSELAEGFEVDEYLRRLRTVRGPRPVRLRVRQAKELFLKRLAARIKDQV